MLSRDELLLMLMAVIAAFWVFAIALNLRGKRRQRAVAQLGYEPPVPRRGFLKGALAGAALFVAVPVLAWAYFAATGEASGDALAGVLVLTMALGGLAFVPVVLLTGWAWHRWNATSVPADLAQRLAHRRY